MRQTLAVLQQPAAATESAVGLTFLPVTWCLLFLVCLSVVEEDLLCAWLDGDGLFQIFGGPTENGQSETNEFLQWHQQFSVKEAEKPHTHTHTPKNKERTRREQGANKERTRRTATNVVVLCPRR